MAYTNNDSLFTIPKIGSGIITKSKLEQSKTPDGKIANWKLLDAVDIDWDKAKLAYTYSATNDLIEDTSDLLTLIDQISHGRSLDWEDYAGE